MPARHQGLAHAPDAGLSLVHHVPGLLVILVLRLAPALGFDAHVSRGTRCVAVSDGWEEHVPHGMSRIRFRRRR